MIDKPRILVTICARAGSKGLPNKNIKKINSIPLISYTINTAIKLKKFYHLILVVSSDHEKILEIAKKNKVDLCIKRPKYLSNDKIGKIYAIRHCLKLSENNFKNEFDFIVDLDVTSPLRTVKDVKTCLEIMIQNKKLTNLISACPSRKSPYFNQIELLKKSNSNFQTPKLVKKTKIYYSRQTAPQTYDMNASIYIWTKKALKNNNLFQNNTYCYIMPENRSIDIDSNLDFELVKLLLKKN